MDSIFELATHLYKGGSEAIISLLVLIIGGLGFEIHRMRKDIKNKEEKLDKIVNDYHTGNMTIADAMNSLKVVLAEIKGKIS